MEIEPAASPAAPAAEVLTELEPAGAGPLPAASPAAPAAVAPLPAVAASAPARPAPRPRPRPSSARAPRPVVSVAPRRGRSKSTKLLAAAGIGALVVAGAFGMRAMTEDAPPVAQVVLPVGPAAAEVSPPPAPAPAAAAKAPTAPQPLSDAEKRRALQGLVFGGRPVTWWEGRLDGLYDDSLAAQPEAYGATLKRVQRMGFVLKEGPPEHGLWPGQTLIEQINSRRAR